MWGLRGDENNFTRACGSILPTVVTVAEHNTSNFIFVRSYVDLYSAIL